ncbi:short chain dehydrogenase [Bordetella trematum]|nr:short chain dehydrogenase [Bordetella trematum]
MRERGQGVILNNIGSGGESYDFDYIAGTTGNAALMAFSRALGGRSLRDGIRVLGVNPGPVATARIEQMLRLRARDQLGDEARYGEFLAKLPRGGRRMWRRWPICSFSWLRRARRIPRGSL